jgi:pimeloyl-ACP methyl ester carboxylesterase
MSSVTLRGQELHYQQVPGQGGSLIFLHGSGGRAEHWSKQMQLGPTCIALDLPGHGRSGGEAQLRIEDYAAWVRDFLQILKPPRPVFAAGFSMGAAISLRLALDHPEILDGLILMGTGQRMKVMPTFLEELHQGRSDPEFVRLGFSGAAPAQLVNGVVQDFAAAGAAVLYADFSACNDFDVTGQLDHMTLPTLVIAGAEDRLTPLKLAQYVADHIPGAQLEVIPAAGHFVMMEQPGEVNRLMRDFCARG